MTAYGWTIDYINDCVTIPQIVFLIEEIKNNPPASISNFGANKTKAGKNNEAVLLKQLDKLGDKVKVESWIDKKTIKSVVRLKDKAVIK